MEEGVNDTSGGRVCHVNYHLSPVTHLEEESATINLSPISSLARPPHLDQTGLTED